MKKIIRIVDLRNQSEADLLDKILWGKNIPHNVVSHHDTAYNGIYALQKGWGFLEAPEQHSEEILSIYDDLQNAETIIEDEHKPRIIPKKNNIER